MKVRFTKQILLSVNVTKAEQLNSNRLRPKPSQKNKDRKSNGLNIEIEAERIKPKAFKCPEYLTWLHNQGLKCFVCGNPYIEIHHVKEHSTDLRNDNICLPLCRLHHTECTILSAHGNTKAFKHRYPMKVQRAEALKLWLKFEFEC